MFFVNGPLCCVKQNERKESEQMKTNLKDETFHGTADAPWYDTQGKPIQAHGGQVQRFTVDGKEKWYWI